MTSIRFAWNDQGLTLLSAEERAAYESTRLVTPVAAGWVSIDSVGAIMLKAAPIAPTSPPDIVVGREVYAT